MRSITIAVLTLVSAGAIAQDPDRRNTIYIEVDRPVLEPGESTTIELRAGFNSILDWAVANLGIGLIGDRLEADLAEYELFGPLGRIPGSTHEGDRTQRGIERIAANQIQFHDILADPADPIGFWRGRYVAPAVDEPRLVAIETETGVYQVYFEQYNPATLHRRDELIEGRATITIVPCRADFNGDGAPDLFDFLAFFNAFDAGDPIADFDFDGELTVFDFLAFQNRFADGC